MENFLSLGLPQPVVNALEALKFHTPTPIQAQVIPFALEGKDILGSAQTGTGKTAAFGLPLVCRLLSEPQSAALVILPTRELAQQVMKTLWDLMGRERESIKSALLIGGEPIFKQLKRLSSRPRLIVGTPGRINDHLKRKSLSLGRTDFVVLDEADRMLDMGFTPQIDNIMKHVAQKRQTLLFSATLPKNIVKMSEKYLSTPERLSVEASKESFENLKQEVIHTTAGEKYGHLLSQLEQREGSVIIFVKTKVSADKIAEKLRGENHSAQAIHGDLKYNQRVRTMHQFRDAKYRIMVATDIAARGLDVAHVKHVINYDLPQCSEDYIHRIGRTARAGAQGSALCLLTPGDRAQWKDITRLLDPAAQSAREGFDTLDQYQRKTFSPQKKQSSSVFKKGRPRPAGMRNFSYDDRPQDRKKERFSRRDDESSSFSRDGAFRDRDHQRDGYQPRGRKKGNTPFARRDDRPRGHSEERSSFSRDGNFKDRDRKKEGSSFARDDNARGRKREGFASRDGRFGDRDRKKEGSLFSRDDRSRDRKKNDRFAKSGKRPQQAAPKGKPVKRERKGK